MSLKVARDLASRKNLLIAVLGVAALIFITLWGYEKWYAPGRDANSAMESAHAEFVKAKTKAEEALAQASRAIADLDRAYQRSREEKQVVPLSLLEEKLRHIQGQKASPKTEGATQ